MWWMCLLTIWMCRAMIALPVALIEGASGNQRVPPEWMGSMHRDRHFPL